MKKQKNDTLILDKEDLRILKRFIDRALCPPVTWQDLDTNKFIEKLKFRMSFILEEVEQ